MAGHIDLVDSLYQRCQRQPGRIAFPELNDPRILSAAQKLISQRLAKNVFLVGSAAQRLQIEKEHPWIGSAGEQVQWVLSDDAGQRAATAKCMSSLAAGRGKVIDNADLERMASNPLYIAGSLLPAGKVDAVIAGAVHTTADVIRAALAMVGLASGIKTVSGAFLMHKAEVSYLYADGGVVVSPTAEALVDIAAATVQTWRTVVAPLVNSSAPPEPRVAFLSFSTKGSAIHPDAQKVQQAADLFRARYPDVVADGEVQFDTATVPEIAARKAPGSLLAGRANCFIFPDLDAGNIAYKITQRLGGFAAYGPLLQGLRYGMSDLSRGASVEDIVNVACLTQLSASAMTPRIQ